jgi:TRAP-type C4-dicarboxylate transport system permease small subunit
LDRFERAFVAANKAVVGLMLAAIFAIVFVNVVMRYGFGQSLSWGEEVARFLMVAGAYFGAGLALREGRLVSIDLFHDLLPEHARHVVRFAIVGLMLVFMVAVVWLGIRFAAFGWNKTTMATSIPRGIPYLAIPIGAGLFIIHTLLFARRFVRSEFEADDGDDDGQTARRGAS